MAITMTAGERAAWRHGEAKKSESKTLELEESLLSEAPLALSDHIRIDERSIALHKAVAEKVRANPQLMEIAKRNLQSQIGRFVSRGQKPPRSLSEWDIWLHEKPLGEMLEFIISRDEKAYELRQSSPFSGILTPQERRKIYETYRAGTHHSSRGQYRRG